MANVQEAHAVECKDGVYDADLAFPIEGNPSQYEVFLDYGVSWCNDEGYGWLEEKDVDCDTPYRHLGIDIKLTEEESTNTSDGSPPNVTKGKKVYAAYDGKACYGDAGGSGQKSWGKFVYIRHELNNFVFYTIYFHVEPSADIPEGTGLCTQGFEVKRRQPIGTPHEDYPSDSLTIATVFNLSNPDVHDRDHLHFAIRCDDVQKKCGGGDASELIANGGKCISPRSFFPDLKSKNLFPDVPSSAWFESYVKELKDKGVISGYADGTFKPGNQTTRAEFVKMAVVAAGKECKWYSCWDSPNYTDVKSSDWYYDYIRAAYTQGWIDTTKTEFYPNNPIQRAEAVKILVTALGEENSSYSTASLFTDVTDPAAWFYPFVYIGKKLKIIDGYPDGTFGPAKNINRAEVAKVIVQAFLQ